MAKILIVRLGAMGDILHAMPAVTAIRQALPEAAIGWIVEEKWSELLTARGHKDSADAITAQKPLANLVHTVNTMRWRKQLLSPATFKEIGGDIGRLRQTHYDVALDFQGNIKSGVLAWLSRAGSRAGFTDPRESGARFFYSRRFARAGEHVIEQNHALAAQAMREHLAGVPFHLSAPLLPRDPSAEAWAESEIKRLGIAAFALVTPGAGWGGKQWPAERFGEVARALAVHNLRTLVNTGPGEEELAREVVAASGGSAEEVKCPVGQLIALTRRARIFIGGDTGPLHLAAALGIPVVGIYGPTDPARTGPFGTKSIALRHPESQTTFSHHREPDGGMLKITADEVITAARRLLGGGHG